MTCIACVSLPASLSVLWYNLTGELTPLSCVPCDVGFRSELGRSSVVRINLRVLLVCSIVKNGEFVRSDDIFTLELITSITAHSVYKLVPSLLIYGQ